MAGHDWIEVESYTWGSAQLESDPSVRDGTTNTLMVGEIVRLLDEPIDHGDLRVVKLVDATNPASPDPDVDLPAVDTSIWVLPDSDTHTGPIVATEELTIAHEGFQLI